MKSVTEWQQDLVGMVLDINPAEIGSHLEDLGSWCKVWQAEMIRKIYDIPATYGPNYLNTTTGNITGSITGSI